MLCMFKLHVCDIFQFNIMICDNIKIIIFMQINGDTII